jgi:hypothetical protein
MFNGTQIRGTVNFVRQPTERVTGPQYSQLAALNADCEQLFLIQDFPKLFIGKDFRIKPFVSPRHASCSNTRFEDGPKKSISG